MIIQGLRESGVFTSVIASAPSTLSKDKFLASIESSNSSRGAPPETLLTRKMGKTVVSHATARKTLESIDDDMDEVTAVPPLSPPGMEDGQSNS